MTGALAGAVSHVLFVVSDLDDPFHGDGRISPAPLESIHSFMQRCLAEEAPRGVGQGDL